ncbi:HesA/MoeB/ThiF family protein [Alistipes sp. OttesenSCG-928-L06]|nr:HesA/MoeB/ThiF family protein [Alistipes sp. OttesenSCG-928-L06]
MEAILSREEKSRYERHLIVPDFGDQEQEKLKNARVLVIGAGGLGSAVLHYLAAAGVGCIGIVEFDTVSHSNLQRQILYTSHDVDSPKAEIAAERLMAINPYSQVITFAIRLTDENAEDIFSDFDLVVDCTDNYQTRYVIDRMCAKLSLPMVYGSAQEAGGQVSIFHAENAGSYAGLYPEEESTQDNTPVGVISPMPGIVGSIQAMETLKLITGYGQTLAGRLLTVDAKTMSFQTFNL